MSYNITGCDIAESKDFYITKADYEALQAEFAEDERLPECNILDEGWVKLSTKVKGDKIYPKNFWWGGNDYSLELLKEKVLPAFKGSADLVLIWEGGDSVSGLRYKGGKVTKHSVGYVLGDAKK
jgi:hypothetical protein